MTSSLILQIDVIEAKVVIIIKFFIVVVILIILILHPFLSCSISGTRILSVIILIEIIMRCIRVVVVWWGVADVLLVMLQLPEWLVFHSFRHIVFKFFTFKFSIEKQNQFLNFMNSK